MLCVLITVALLCAYVSRMATHCFAMLFFFRAAFVLNFFFNFSDAMELESISLARRDRSRA